jgi:DNA-binding response OmpR family regulator
MRVLLIEDDPLLGDALQAGLHHNGFAVEWLKDGMEGLAAMTSDHFDAVVLDLGLPSMDGLDVVRELRRDSAVPVVILTARGDETDRVSGLELGADDYVVKPFSPRELVARVRAVLRRTEAAANPTDRLVSGDLEVDLAKHRVAVAGRPVALTPTEFALLAALAREPGRVFTRGQLLDAVHGFSLETYERAIDGHVKNLRRKIEPDPGAPRYLLTVHGVGYALAEPAG